MLNVVLYLKAAPSHRIALQVKNDYAGRIEYFADEAKAYARAAQIRTLTAVDVANRQRALFMIDELLNERGTRVAEALRDSAEPQIATVRNAIEAYGGTAHESSAVLASVRGIVPAQSVFQLASHPDVTYVDLHIVGGPLLENQKQSLGLTNALGFWTNGVDGGAYDVGVMDTGVQRNHPAFAPLNWEGVTTDPDGHGTGVGGMIFSNDSTYRGMAFGLDTVSVADANLGMREAADWLLTSTIQRPEAINVSWGGQSPDTNEYQAIEAWFDSAADAFDILFGQAAGNEGASGYGTLVYPAKAYNTIAVANVYDFETVTRSDDKLQNSSSRGPTPAGRKKPDIAAPGNNTWSTTRTLGFGNLGGTSSAAPKVTGGAVLLRDAGLTSSLEDKAVLINSADAWSDNNTLDPVDDGPALGSHWSRAYGWGYLDLLSAYQQAPFVITDTFQRPLLAGLRRIAYYAGTRPAGFKSTLVWNRHVGPYTGEDPVEYDSLTNFNLTLYNGTTGAAIAQSVSTIDNVEQIGTSTSGASVVKVHTTGNWDIDVDQETFALALPNLFVRRNPPSFDVTVNVTSYAVVGSEVSVSGTVTNTGELPVFDVLASVNAVVVGGNNPTQLGTLDPGETVPVNWLVQVEQAPGAQNIRISVEGAGYGETFVGSGQQEITIIPFFLAPTTHTVVRGIVTGGDLTSVTSSNNVHLQVRPGITFTTAQWPVEIVFRRISPVTAPQFFYVRAESNATAATIRQRFEAFNYNTNAWVILNESNLTTGDIVRLYSVPGNVAHFQHPTTREVQLRVSAKAFGPVFAYPWTFRLDQIGWHIDD
jgi:serine protease AprX